MIYSDEFLSEIREQAEKEIRLGYDFILPKRERYREKLIKYVDQNKEEGKIGVNLIYSQVNLKIAIRLTDDAEVLFLPTGIGDEEYADNLTDIANYDNRELELKKLDYARYWDDEVFGYSIRTRAGWDNIRKCPIVNQEDPLSRIPDPYSDFMTLPRFHYFDKEIKKSDMKKEYGFIEDIVETLIPGKSPEKQNTDMMRNQAEGYNNIMVDTSNDFYVSVVDGYTYYKGELYKITLVYNSRQIVRLEKIKPVRKEEKESGYIDIRTQVVVERSSPQRGNPCGISPAFDLIEDKQSAISEFMNMRLIDAKFNTYGQLNIVNTDMIKNTVELTKPSLNTKWIGANAGNQSLSNAIYPVPRQSIMQDSYNTTNELMRQLQLDTGISDNTLGVAEKGLTATESQQVQINANLRLALGITINNWGEKDFWNFIWLRSYEEHFSSSDKKLIRVSNGFGVNVIEIRKDDFNGGANPDIVIDSKKQLEARRQKEGAEMLAIAPMILEDPTKPNVVKNSFKRHLLRLRGVDRELINVWTFDPVEEKAKMLIPLLNNNDTEGAEIEDMTEDHLTYLIIFERALDTKAKEQAIFNRRQALIMSGQMNKQQEMMNSGMMRQTQAQATANVLSGNTPVSTANI